MNITLHQLKVFKTVANLRSVTGASQALHMTQPAVSNILRQLESHYGVKLTEVINRKLYLTSFGEIIYDLSKSMEQLLSDFEMKISMAKGAVTGDLNVTIASTAKYFMPYLLSQFKALHKGIHVSMKVYPRELVLNRLEQNLDDFVVLTQLPQTINVDAYPIFSDELVIVTNPMNKFAKRRSVIELSELANEYWIIREEGSGTRLAMFEYFKKHKFTPKIDMELGNNEAIKQAIIANMGISMISKRSIHHEVDNNLIKILKINKFYYKHVWYAVKLKNKLLSPIAQNFIDLSKKKEVIVQD